MGLPIDELKNAILRAGFVPGWVTAYRSAGGKDSVMISAVYDPESITPMVEAEPQPSQMIPQPAGGWIHVDQLAKMSGIGPKTLERITEYIDVLKEDGGDKTR